ncbi:MAG: gerAA 2 [Firmicutes bacterium]|nr:gerAA 2 [Bacillota bacterium]
MFKTYKNSTKLSDSTMSLAERQASQRELERLKKMIIAGSDVAQELALVIEQLRRSASNAENQKVFATIDENFSWLHDFLGQGIGLTVGKYDILAGNAQAGIAYIESIADKQLISSYVIEPLLTKKVDSNIRLDNLLNFIQLESIYIHTTSNYIMTKIVESLLNGDAVLFINGLQEALVIGSRKIEKRSIEKPDNEGTVLASLESFTDDLETNCSMVIKRLPITTLCFEAFTQGELSRTKLKLVWLEGIANEKVIEEVERRIKKINVDNLDGVGNLAELIEDKPLSIFPKYRQTQRPDVVAKALTEGHFAVLCNNSPFAFFAPITLWDNFKTMDDYAERVTSSSYLRLVRYVAFAIAVLVSPVYLSFVTYNHIVVPQSLAVNISTGREGVPFPSGIELVMMTLAISIIREASLRIPGSVGYFIGTLAAVVIGQAAVTAGYVSTSIIIVVAVSEISSFAISTTTLVYTTRLINYFFITLASVLGMFGLINGMIIVMWYVVSLESFGVPYLYPLIPFDLEGMKDTFVRLAVLKKRLRLLAPFNRYRIGPEGNSGKRE